jgi:hypothetical protein
MLTLPRVLSWVVALGCVVAGAALLTGLVQAEAPRGVRIGCGIVLMLLGVKRWAVTQLQAAAERRQERDDEPV